MNDQPTRSAEQLIDIGRRLTASWNANVESFSLRRGDVDIARAGVVYGLVAHVHRVAPIVLSLIGDGLVLESIPLVRLAYETALTAQWTVQIEGAAAALANEHIRHRRALVRTLNLSQQLKPWASQFVDEEEFETTVSSRSFQSQCDDLTPGGPDAYAHFRLMSQLAHPSVMLADSYIEEQDTDLGFAFSNAPHQLQPTPYLAFTVAALVWSGRAFDFLDRDHRRRNELRAAAKVIGISSVLAPSLKALGYTPKK